MPRVTHRLLLTVVAVLGVASLIAMAALYPGRTQTTSDPDAAQISALVDATLLEVVQVPTADPSLLPPGAVDVEVTARLGDSGEIVVFTMVDDTGDTFRAGQRVRLTATTSEGASDGAEVLYGISDFQRDGPLLLLSALFVGAVVGFGRWQGLRALCGLVITGIVVVGVLVPSVLGGANAVAAAIAASTAIMIVTLYLSHGTSRKTTAAAVGTAVALALTGALAVAFVGAANLTGFSSEEARLVNLEAGGLSLRGLLLAGIIVGGLGVLDDVTVSQSSTVFELHRADPRAGFAALTRGALSVGRDHIAATVNTLFLAYAGASLPLLILFATGIDPMGTVVTSEIVAVEVVRTLVGSLGLIAAVPVTTALAAALALGEPEAAAAEAEAARGHAHAPRPASGPARTSWGTRPHPRAGADAEDDWVADLRAAYDLPDDGDAPQETREGQPRAPRPGTPE